MYLGRNNLIDTKKVNYAFIPNRIIGNNGNITGLPQAPLSNLKEVIDAACWNLDPAFAQSQYLGPVVEGEIIMNDC